MLGETILHYKIVEKIGEGGMGIVYLAEDTKLERKVAIKFLPHQITVNDDERERLRLEAKAAASLNHHNIGTIHAIEEYENEKFIVMEYVEGQELKDLIRDNNFSIKESIQFAIQIAEGLEAAHKKGIVHRDIKTANIMVTTDGKIKIMDFGLAKVAGAIQLTREGVTGGTTEYMSPEQAKGEEIDLRTDIWSFGIVLYEMLSGESPFRQDYEQAIIYSILNDPFIPLKDIPPELEKVIEKLLKKEPSERYQDMGEVLNDLFLVKSKFTEDSRPVTKTADKNWGANILKILPVFLLLIIIGILIYYFQANENNPKAKNDLFIGPKRLAVLPLTNIRDDEETNYLGFALTDQIISSLQYVNNIIVRPSGLVRQYQNKPINFTAISNDLKVDYILSGNYLKEQDTVRLNFELVDIHSSKLLWHDNLQLKYENTFKLQDIVSEEVTKGLRVSFSSYEHQRINNDIPNNSLAYEYYLRSISYPNTNEASTLAEGMLLKSIELDSNFAPAYSELGYRKSMLSMYKLNERKTFIESEEAYEKALSLNDELLPALSGLAALYSETGQTQKAIKLMKKALKINPNSAESHFFLGYAYRYCGFLKEAVEEMEEAVKLDPNNPRFRSIGVTYCYIGNYKKALEGLNLDSKSPYGIAWKGNIYLRMNKPNEALALFDSAITLEPNGIIAAWSKGMRSYITGRRKEAEVALRKIDNTKIRDGEQSYHEAAVCALIHLDDISFSLLRKSIDSGFFNYPFMVKDMFFNSVRNNPKYKELLAIAKTKYEEFKKENE